MDICWLDIMEDMGEIEVFGLMPAEEATLWAGVELTQGIVGVGSPDVLMDDGGWGLERGGHCWLRVLLLALLA